MPSLHCHKIMQWFSYLVMIASAIDIIVQTWIFILACSSFWTYFSYLLKSSSSLCSSPSNSPLLPSGALHKHSSPPALQIIFTSYLLFSWMTSGCANKKTNHLGYVNRTSSEHKSAQENVKHRPESKKKKKYLHDCCSHAHFDWQQIQPFYDDKNA